MKQTTIILLLLIVLFPIFSFSERDLGPRPILNKAKVAELIVYYTNIERIKKGRNLLIYNSVLTAASEIHSKYMLDNRDMTHYETKLSRPEDRVKEACKTFEKNCLEQFNPSEERTKGSYTVCCGENVIASFANTSAGISYREKTDEKGKYKDWVKIVNWYSEEALAKDLVERWMNSPGHRQNILNPEYGAMGAAISDYSESSEYYYGTQVFSPIPTEGIKTQDMKFDPIVKEEEKFRTTLDGGEVLEKYALVLTKISGDGDFTYSKKGKLYSVQTGNLKTETVILIEIQDPSLANIRYPYWKFKFIPNETLPKIDWVNW